MNTKKTKRVAVVAVAAALLSVGCAKDKKPEIGGAAQYSNQGPSSLIPAVTPSSDSTATTSHRPTTTRETPISPEEEAEAAAPVAEELTVSDFSTGTDMAVDRSDVRAVALRWGCAYRASPAGEGTDAWQARLGALMTERGRTKLAPFSSPADETSTVVQELGAVEIEPATAESGAVFRVNCFTWILDAQGEHLADGPIAPVFVAMKSENGQWAVDDFSFGGIEFSQ